MKKIRSLFILLFVLAASHTHTFGASYFLLDKADKAYEQASYAEAVAIYIEVYKKAPSYELACRIAECYNTLRKYEQALQWSNNILRYPSHTPFDETRNLMLLLYNGRYADLKTASRRYASVLPEDINYYVACADSAMRWMKQPKECAIRKMNEFNTPGSDFGLVRMPDKSYVFCSDARKDKSSKNSDDEQYYGWTGRGYLGLYLYDDRKNVKPLFDDANTTEINVGPISFSSDGREIFYSATLKGKDKTAAAGDYKKEVQSMHPGIYSRKKESNGKWGAPIPFEYNNEENYSMGDPWLTADGQRLYFVSDIPYGMGNTKIYYSVRNSDGSFNKPVEVDSGINTVYIERFPRFDSIGNFYFSSNGHPGMGGLDVFKVEVKDGKMGTPVNMGYPFNSPQDDYAPFFATSYSGYLSSNRKGGRGEDDIYGFSFKPRPGGVDTIPEEKPVEEFAPIQIGKTGVASVQSQEPEVQLGIKDVSTTNVAIRLNNIYYDPERWEVRSDVGVELDKLVALLKKYPRMELEIRSHTDTRGTPKYNQTLSQMRAQSVVNYIAGKGINPSRLVAKGFGDTRPMVKCGPFRRCTESEHQLNRRTEFVILRKE